MVRLQVSVAGQTECGHAPDHSAEPLSPPTWGRLSGCVTRSCGEFGAVTCIFSLIELLDHSGYPFGSGSLRQRPAEQRGDGAHEGEGAEGGEH